MLGAQCGAEDNRGNLDQAQLDKLDRYGKCIGLAFQVVDDVLDSEADGNPGQDRRQRR